MTKLKFFTKSELIKYKTTLMLTDIQKEIIVGTLLGDASMSLRYNKPDYAIKFEQSIKRRSYIEHLFQIFEPFCLSSPSVRIINKQDLLPNRESIYFKTIRHTCFIYYFNLFYKIEQIVDQNTGIVTLKKTKVIPKNIHQLLTPRVIAYWFMDDGTYEYDQQDKTRRSYVFSTQSFQKHECQILLDALRTNFKINGQLHKDKHYWRIYITRESSVVLRQLMEPYIHCDFTYKI